MLGDGTDDNKKQNFVQELVLAGYEEALAFRALEYINPEDVTAGIVWCMDHEEDNFYQPQVENEPVIEQITHKPAFSGWSKSQTNIQTMITANISGLKKTAEVKMLGDATDDNKKQNFVHELVLSGYEEALAFRALEFINPEDVTAGIVWCMDHEEDNFYQPQVENEPVIEQITHKPAFSGWSKSQTDIQTMITANISGLKKTAEVKMLGDATDDNKKQNFVHELVLSGYEEALAFRALEFINPEDVTAGIVWCMDHEEDNFYQPQVGNEPVIEQITHKPAFSGWSKSQTDIQTMITANRAAGGYLSSLNNGSDADFELTCTPCEEGSIREEAVKYCPICQEYLCTTCTMHHGRQKATRTHTLLDRDEAKKGSLVTKMKCCYHPDREIEMFCGTHDMVYCVMCIATEHRLCGKVKKIEDKSKSRVSQTEIRGVLDETKNATDRIKALIIKQQKNKTSLKDQRNHTEEKLQEIETNLIEHIKKLKRETSESLHNSYAKMDGELDSSIRASTNTIQNLEKTSKQVQSLTGMDAVQQFVKMKLMKKTVTEANKLHADVVSNGKKSVDFTENTDLITSVMSANTFGKVRTEAEEKKPSKAVQYKKKPNKKIM